MFARFEERARLVLGFSRQAVLDSDGRRTPAATHDAMESAFSPSRRNPPARPTGLLTQRWIEIES